MFLATRPHTQLPMLFNVYCDKFLTERYTDMPFVFHYRGANRLAKKTLLFNFCTFLCLISFVRLGSEKWATGGESGGMKPWIMNSQSDPRSWLDLWYANKQTNKQTNKERIKNKIEFFQKLIYFFWAVMCLVKLT